MKVAVALRNWLQSPRRSYVEGVELFSLLAPKELKDKFLTWFRNAPSKLSGTDMHITLLIDKLSRLNRETIVNPAAYADILDSEFMPVSDEKKSVSAVPASPEVSSQPVASSDADMPDNIRKAYERIKEITPLYAKLHSELSAAASDADRKALASQLCDLDDERRRLWTKIDSWSDGKEVVTDEPRPEYSDNQLLLGMQIERSIKRVRDNIGTAKATIARLEKSDDKKKDEKLAKVRTRKALLETELDTLLRRKAEVEASK